jgi:hypothetical protein
VITQSGLEQGRFLERLVIWVLELNLFWLKPGLLGFWLVSGFPCVDRQMCSASVVSIIHFALSKSSTCCVHPWQDVLNWSFRVLARVFERFVNPFLRWLLRRLNVALWRLIKTVDHRDQVCGDALCRPQMPVINRNLIKTYWFTRNVSIEPHTDVLGCMITFMR